jgi:hypothetical protein
MPYVLISGEAGGEAFTVRVPYKARPPGQGLLWPPEIDWLGITNEEDGSHPSGPVRDFINTSYGYGAIMAEIAEQMEGK